MWKIKTLFLTAAWAGCYGSPAMAGEPEAPVVKSAAVGGEFYQFMPDNDLNLEDTGFLSNVSQDQFNHIIAAAYQLYLPAAQQRNETLQIRNNWSDSTVNANCSRGGGVVTINMYGGLARRSEITPEGFALVLCHELGHAYGGRPYIHPSTQIATEGQADYYGAQTCLKALLPKVDKSYLTADDYVQSRCSQTRNHGICVRQMLAGQSLGTLLAAISQQPVPDYQTPDQTVVSQTLLSYPRTIQCRLDTYNNGILGLARPACWFRQ